MYCVLGEGKLQFYDAPRGILLQEMILSGYKIKVKYIQNTRKDLPHRLLVQIRKKVSLLPTVSSSTSIWNFPWKNVRMKKKESTLNNHRFILSAPSSGGQQQWAIAILNWHKHCWEPSSPIDHSAKELQALHVTLKQFGLYTAPTYAA